MDASEARARLDETGEAILVGVERCLPGWVEREVERILDAWGRVPATARDRARRDARAAGRAATDRVLHGLRTLFAAAPAEQRATPLEIVRGAYREPTQLLRDLGVPPVERDAFDERAWPDDRYGLVPRSLADIGDESLGPLLLAWGLAKARAIRPD
ncbi:MAG TPA: hypothetical protein VF152_01740 [Acidimicrobiia bacterium]